MSFRFKFGTAGIRAQVGAADDELSLRSVRAIAAAIVARLTTLPLASATREVCVAFDGRRDSQRFAHEICAVALAQGFTVALFDEPSPTPLLAFCVRKRAALAGIVVTASHNPPKDNGIKLYLHGGVQIAAPLDREIEALIARDIDPDGIALGDLALARSQGALTSLGAPERQAYLERLEALVPSRRDLRVPRLAYSALCGVGSVLTRELLAMLGASDVVEVREQAYPRADFGGLSSPNPEEASAVALLWECAQAAGVDMAFAHDPDADRLAVLSRAKSGELRRLSGDDVGALLADFLLSQHPEPARALLVSTLVSGGLAEQITAAYGARYLRTQTGFKWIAQRGRSLAVRDALDLVFGYEEALGYAFFGMADDKDGVAALYVLCELARRLTAQGKTLLDRLEELEAKHGVFLTRQLNVVAPGPDGPERMQQILSRLRNVAPDQLLGRAAVREDFELGPEPFPLLVLSDAAGTRVCVRPSGTEPKLKLYLHVREPAHHDAAAARSVAVARLDALERALAAYTNSATGV